MRAESQPRKVNSTVGNKITPFFYYCYKLKNEVEPRERNGMHSTFSTDACHDKINDA